MPKPPPAQADNVPPQWTTTAMAFHLLCNASFRILTPTHRFACNQVLPTTHLHRTDRRRLEMLEDGEDRAEPCVRTKTGTLSGHWKTARWKKAGLEEVRAPRRAGREATCDERTSHRGGSTEFLFPSLSMNDSARLAHLYCICRSAGAVADMSGWLVAGL